MKIKKYRVECLSETVFTITKTKILKKRLRELKKKPKKNQYGISRIQAELDRRIEQQANSYIESLREFRNSVDNEDNEKQTKEEIGLSEEEYNEALEIVREMKGCVVHKINEDPSFIENLRKNSDKLKVIAEIRYENDEIYGYEIKNISKELICLKYSESEFEVLCPEEMKTIELSKFIRMACQPEISFTFSNGVVRKAISRKEELKQIRETGNKINLRNYHVVPKQDSEPIPVVFIQE